MNILEKQLRGNGWNVLRPDRECPDLSWEEYLNWVSKQVISFYILSIDGKLDVSYALMQIEFVIVHR